MCYEIGSRENKKSITPKNNKPNIKSCDSQNHKARAFNLTVHSIPKSTIGYYFIGNC